MQLSNLPARILAAFAVSGSKRTIPVASQIGVTPGAASYETGFPPLTMTPLASGGIPPAGVDFNGIFNAITLIQQWQSAGGGFPYDAAWATANNGYPKGAVLMRADGTGFWFNTTENNTADPDGATPTGWVPEWQAGVTSVAGLTNANVTLSSSQYGRPVIACAGALTGNVQIILPAISGEQWLVANYCTGNFTLTFKTAAGTGVIVPNAQNAQIWCDGTGILPAGAGGRLLNTIILTTPGASVYNATPGTVYVEVEGCGGGGGGGGVTATAAGEQAAGAGGAGGGYFRKKILSGFNGTTVTVGAGGVGGTGAVVGTAGGTTSFGAVVGYAGGAAGSPGGAATIAGSNTFPTGTGIPPNTGIGAADIFATGGQGFSAWYGPGGSAAGQGGSSYLGPGAYGPISLLNLNSNGFNAASNGGGGGGALNGPSQAARKGGDGANGIVIIREYS